MKYSELIEALSVFAKMGAYGVIDRIAGALTPEAVEHALYDALRGLNAMVRQAAQLKIRVDGKEEVINVVDWSERLDDPRFQLAEEGEVVEVLKGPSELKGRRIRFVRAPSTLPSSNEVDDFITKVREQGFEGLSLARRIALMALSKR